jgi:hypothetical protein
MLKIAFGWCFAPDPIRELTALPQTPSCIAGPLRGRVNKKEGKGKEGKRGEDGREGRGSGSGRRRGRI